MPVLETISTEPGTTGDRVPRDRAGGITSLLFWATMLALVVLLTCARAGTPRLLLGCLAGGFLAIALLWAGASLIERRHGRTTLPTRGAVTVLACAAALALVTAAAGGVALRRGALSPGGSWYGVASITDFLFFAGVLLLYLSAGLGIARARAWVGRRTLVESANVATGAADPRPRWWRLARPGTLLAAMALMVIAVMWGLGTAGDSDTRTVLVSLLLGLLLMPAVLSVLAEHGVVAASRVEMGDRLVSVMVAAVVLVVAAVGFTWWRWDSPLGAVALVAVALLAVCLASSTLLDVALVLALVALAGATPLPDDPIPASGGQRVLVALGDSYMSGEGAARYVRGTDVGGGNTCRQARTAWAARAGRTEPFDGVRFYACSGADSYNIRLTSGMQPPLEGMPRGTKTQLAQYIADGGTRPALVVLSVGGNDAGFSTIGLTCMAPSDCDDPVPSALWSNGNLRRLENRLRQVYADVARTFPESPVAVVPYPDPVGDPSQFPCRSAGLSRGDVRFVDEFLQRLNDVIERVSSEYGFYFVGDVVDSLAVENRQLCDRRDAVEPGINFLGLRSVSGAARQRFNPGNWLHNSLHPNELGHAAMLAAFERWLAAEGGLAGLTERPRQSSTEPRSEEYDEVGTDCSQYEAGDDCISRSRAWAVRQSAVFLFERGWLVVLVLVGGWVVTVAGMGLSRRRAAQSKQR